MQQRINWLNLKKKFIWEFNSDYERRMVILAIMGNREQNVQNTVVIKNNTTKYYVRRTWTFRYVKRESYFKTNVPNEEWRC